MLTSRHGRGPFQSEPEVKLAGVSPRAHGDKELDGRVSGWAAPAISGAVAFWLVNLAISATPTAADYRHALSIRYLPMLVEAAVGGLVLGVVLTFLLLRHTSKIPGSSMPAKALLLGALALAVVTIGIETPSKFTSGVDDPAHWLLVATIINLLRILALAAAVGLIADVRARRRSRQPGRE